MISPKMFKQYLAFWQKEKRLYAGGVLDLLIGIIFLLAASQCRLVGTIIALGIIGLLKGILIFTVGLKMLNPIFSWWQERPLPILRLIASITIAFGALIIYSV